LDPIAVIVDATSVALLLLSLLIGTKALRAFRQSKQAVTESASLLEVIVNGLTSRMEVSESVVKELQSDFDAVSRRSTSVDSEQTRLRANQIQLLHHLQEALTNDRRLIFELQQLKTKLGSIPQLNATRDQTSLVLRHRNELALRDGEIFSTLTATERHTLQIVAHEGPKAAPDLARRLKRSREHMARLMKRLYFEGYVDRESTRPPFTYRLNDKVRLKLRLASESISDEVSDPS
jgi:DNA-binding MarR family transcriptional regulator